MKVLLADDHALFRDGTRMLLRPLAKSIHFFESDSFQSTIDVLSRNHKLDLVFLDYLMPGLNGVEAVREIVRSFPETPVLVVSAVDDPALMAAILETGVAGFFPKSQNSTVLLGAVRLILSGGKYIPEGIVLPRRRAGPSIGPGTLTQRQSQVLRLLYEGASNLEIAQALNLSMPTVKMHVRNLFRLLGVSNRMKAVIRARELGITGDFPSSRKNPRGGDFDRPGDPS